MNKNGQNGFTIVELLIVIVVIGILAAITIVSYSGIQAKANDVVRRTDVADIRDALQLYQVDKGDYAQAGCGNGTGTGYFATDYDGAGSDLSIVQCLVVGKYLAAPPVDPSGQLSCSGLGCYTYMKASCAGGTYVYAHLQSLPQVSTDTDGTCQPTWDTSYGINYWVRVDQ
jgi:prepilin-type N-terminal cleavage/methylation domain-containing protein